MTTLSEKEREDLQTVFSSIQDINPSHGGIFCRLKFFICERTVSRLSALSKKRATYHK